MKITVSIIALLLYYFLSLSFIGCNFISEDPDPNLWKIPLKLIQNDGKEPSQPLTENYFVLDAYKETLNVSKTIEHNNRIVFKVSGKGVLVFRYNGAEFPDNYAFYIMNKEGISELEIEVKDTAHDSKWYYTSAVAKGIWKKAILELKALEKENPHSIDTNNIYEIIFHVNKTKESGGILLVDGIGKLNNYDKLKENCANNPYIFYEDFNENFIEENRLENRWSINGNTWWFTHHNGETPQTQDSFLILSSEKNEYNSTSMNQEAQTMESFYLSDNGELIIGLWSDRWRKYPELVSDYWADSSVGLEIWIKTQEFPNIHYAVVFIYGHLGVFYDPTGNCDHTTAECQYDQVEGWQNIANTDTPIAIRIAWTGERNNKIFNLYIITGDSEDTNPLAVISNVNYIGSEALRIRFNANVTDENKLPETDKETLKIDYVCLR